MQYKFLRLRPSPMAITCSAVDGVVTEASPAWQHMVGSELTRMLYVAAELGMRGQVRHDAGGEWLPLDLSPFR